MQPEALKKLLQRFQSGEVGMKNVLRRLKTLPFESLPFASVDHHRSLRQGFPEVIYCPGKSLRQISGIARSLLKQNTPLLATRADAGIYKAIQKIDSRARFHPDAGAVTVRHKKQNPSKITPGILIITAGTADFPAAEEAKVTLELLDHRVETLYDVGVAGIHRLLGQKGKIEKARVIIVVAGMDGALPSVIGGLVDVPIIAVPTSCGYGTGTGGIAALLTMLNSCANGVAVMNIDNGFGAACFAHRINRINGPVSSGK